METKASLARIGMVALAASAAVCVPLPAWAVDEGSGPRLPGPAAMAAARTDVWGEAAIRRPDGPSYEFFRDLLPPLRYANTEFRFYPIMLCAPAAPVKARWISNGSAVNARANKKPMWKEIGVPVHFFVGEQGERFGDDFAQLDGPRYAEGYLPLVQIHYKERDTVYEQEAFVPVRGALADRGVVLLRFQAHEAAGIVRVRFGVEQPVREAEHALVNEQDAALLAFDPSWSWDPDAAELRVRLAPGHAAVLAVPTQPLPEPRPELSGELYQQERAACVAAWMAKLGHGTKLAIPEPVVQNAWRSLVIGNFLIASGDHMNYSAGNAYDHLYEAECGDATRALLLYGFRREAREMVGPLLDFHRQATRFHVAGHKLQLLNQYFQVTRDAAYVRAKEPVWKPVVELITRNRQPENGLLPPDRYAGDISQQVYSLNSNANCWRGLRDLSAVLAELGETDRAERLAREASAYREAILAAVARSEQRATEPPFIPNALFGEEKAYDTLTATRFGSYYDLMAPYILGSGVFGPGADRETWMIRYLREHGGIAMGMIRSMPHQGEFNGQPGVNVLYGLRYMVALLERDDRDHALVGFYGQLAQGMTRDTCIGGEGSRFLHGDEYGRSFYLPPNSASNAAFLITLRYLLIQDWDLDDDGRPDTLRLLYGAPSRWLRDGSVLAVEHAPTMFGPVSFRVEPHLAAGEVQVELEAPPRVPKTSLLRLPLPAGWKTISARSGESRFPVSDDGAINLTRQSGRLTIQVRVQASGR